MPVHQRASPRQQFHQLALRISVQVGIERRAAKLPAIGAGRRQTMNGRKIRILRSQFV